MKRGWIHQDSTPNRKVSSRKALETKTKSASDGGHSHQPSRTRFTGTSTFLSTQHGEGEETKRPDLVGPQTLKGTSMRDRIRPSRIDQSQTSSKVSTGLLYYVDEIFDDKEDSAGQMERICEAVNVITEDEAWFSNPENFITLLYPSTCSPRDGKCRL